MINQRNGKENIRSIIISQFVMTPKSKQHPPSLLPCLLYVYHNGVSSKNYH